MVRKLFFLTVFLAISIPSVQDHYGFNIFGGITLKPFEISFALVFLFYVIDYLLGMKRPLRSSLSVPMAVFLAVATVWTIWGSQLYGVRAALYDVRPVFYYALFFVGLGVIKTKKDVDTFLKVSISGIFVYSIILLAEFFMKSGPMWTTRPDFLQDTNRIGAANGIVTIIALPFIIFPMSSKLLRKEWKIWTALLLIALIIVVLTSQSRASIAAILFIFLISLAVLIRSGKVSSIIRLVVLFGIMSLAGLYFVTEEFISKLSGLTTVTFDSSFLTRYLTALISLENISHSPLFGYGFGSLMVESSRETQGTVLDVTNYFIDWTWITIVFKVGVVGGGVFAWLWQRGFKVIKTVKTTDEWLWVMKKASVLAFFVIIALSIQNAFLIKGQVIVFVAGLFVLMERLRTLSMLSEGVDQKWRIS